MILVGEKRRSPESINLRPFAVIMRWERTRDAINRRKLNANKSKMTNEFRGSISEDVIAMVKKVGSVDILPV
jgi:hypothetical protein